MKEPVYIIRWMEGWDDAVAASRLKEALSSLDLLSFVQPRDMVAVKTHFGEGRDSGYVRPQYLKEIGVLIKSRKAHPFLTETQTLYKGHRSDAVSHLNHAQKQGFGHDQTGMPIIMADGLYGDDEIEVAVPGRIYQSVKIASLIVKAHAAVIVSHFTGHLAAGFGCAIKNMGMGCASRKGKMIQHSTAKPTINAAPCTRCGSCEQWCPADAITMSEESAVIDHDRCIGCGQCLAVCRFDAVEYNWGATYEDLQKKVVEHAWGVARCKANKILYVNVITRVSKDCDCMTGYEQIVPDIGILISRDPVAADAAGLDLVESRAGTTLDRMAYDIPYRHQIEYAAEIGFGSGEYELVEV